MVVSPMNRREAPRRTHFENGRLAAVTHTIAANVIGPDVERNPRALFIDPTQPRLRERSLPRPNGVDEADGFRGWLDVEIGAEPSGKVLIELYRPGAVAESIEHRDGAPQNALVIPGMAHRTTRP